MPAGDGTGPMGMGPMTGRGAGYCAGFGVPGFANPLPGMGWGGRGGWGRGGRGWRHWFYATGLPFWARAMGVAAAGQPPTDYQAQMLKTQAEHMEKALEEIRRRISELEAAKAQES